MSRAPKKSGQMIDQGTVAYFVVLCSSLTNLQTLHMFQLANSSPKFPLSVRDPCIFSINDFEHPTANPVTISLIIAPYTQGKTPDPTAIGQAYMKSAVRFYQLFLLSDNLCLKEYFYIEFPTEFENEIVFPNVLSRPTTPQSPYRIQDDFVVPNGILVDEIEDGEIKRALSRYRQINNEYVSDVLKEDPWTINFEWLAKLLNSPTSFLSSGPRHLQSYIPMSQALGLIESEASNASTTDRSELSSLYVISSLLYRLWKVTNRLESGLTLSRTTCMLRTLTHLRHFCSRCFRILGRVAQMPCWTTAINLMVKPSSQV